MAFAKRHAELEKTRAGRKELRELWEKLSYQCEWRMSGEPYYGYHAEQMLKSRGRR